MVLFLCFLIVLIAFYFSIESKIGSLRDTIEKLETEMEATYKILTQIRNNLGVNDEIHNQERIGRIEKVMQVMNDASTKEPIISQNVQSHKTTQNSHQQIEKSTPYELSVSELLSEPSSDTSSDTSSHKPRSRKNIKDSVSNKSSTPTSHWVSDLIRWMIIDRPLKLGALLLILGLGRLVTYAFMNNRIPEYLRIVLGCLLGVGIVYIGRRRCDQTLNQGSVIIGVGVIMYMMTVWSGRYFFEFMTPQLALFIISLMVIVIGYISITKKYLPLAVMAIVAGSAAPFLTVSADANPTLLLAYYFLLSMGSVCVSWYMGWKKLYLGTVILFVVYSLIVSYVSEYSGIDLGMIDLYIAFSFGVLYLLTNVLQILEDEALTIEGFSASLMNAGMMLFWILRFVPSEMDYLYLFLIAIICFIIAVYIYQNSKSNTGFLQYSIFSVIFIGVGLLTILGNEMLIMAYTILSGVLIMGGIVVTGNTDEMKYAKYTYIIPSFQVFSSMISYLGGQELASGYLIAWLLYGITSIGILLTIHWYQDKRDAMSVGVRYHLAMIAFVMSIYMVQGDEYFLVAVSPLLGVSVILIDTLRKNIDLSLSGMCWFIMPILNILTIHRAGDMGVGFGGYTLGVWINCLVLICLAIYFIVIRKKTDDESVAGLGLALLHGVLGTAIIGVMHSISNDFYALGVVPIIFFGCLLIDRVSSGKTSSYSGLYWLAVLLISILQYNVGNSFLTESGYELLLWSSTVLLLLLGIYFSFYRSDSKNTISSRSLGIILGHLSVGLGLFSVFESLQSEAFVLAGLLLVLVHFVIFSQLGKSLSTYRGLLTWLIVPGLISITTVIMSDEWSYGVLHIQSLTLLSIIGSLYAIWVYIDTFTEKFNENIDLNKSKIAVIKATLGYIGGAYIFCSIWLISHSLLENVYANLLSLVLYTIFGIYTYLKGKRQDNRDLLYLGSGVLIGVCLRLLIVDVWELSIVRRIITFVLLGVMFMSSGFFGKSGEKNLQDDQKVDIKINKQGNQQDDKKVDKKVDKQDDKKDDKNLDS